MAYRRFFFSGSAAGKFEVGITAREGETSQLTRARVGELINHVLSLPVSIPIAPDEPVHCELWQAGKHLARLYASSSMATAQTRARSPEDWWIKAAAVPLLFLTSKTDRVDVPFRSVSLPLPDKLNFNLLCSEINHNGHDLRMWVMDKIHHLDRHDARELRVKLLRLHAESECLKFVLRELAARKLVVAARSNESHKLQTYFNKATGDILQLESQSQALSGYDTTDMARSLIDKIDVGEREALAAALKQIDIRANISSKLNLIIHNTYINDYSTEQFVGDKNIVNQAAAVGSNSRAENVTLNQVVIQGDGLQLSEIAKELTLLRTELKGLASEPEHDIAIGEVAAAQRYAEQGDGGNVLEHLKRAGAWALSVAQNIGTDLVVEVMKESVKP